MVLLIIDESLQHKQHMNIYMSALCDHTLTQALYHPETHPYLIAQLIYVRTMLINAVTITVMFSNRITGGPAIMIPHIHRIGMYPYMEYWNVSIYGIYINLQGIDQYM